MNNMISNLLVLFSVVAFISSAIALAAALYGLNRTVRKSEMNDLIIKMDSTKNNLGIEYSNDLIQFMKSLILIRSIIRFKEFKDSHDMHKITKINMEKLIDKIAHEVHDSIQFDHINFNDTLFNEEFLNNYIIDTTVMTVKSLLEKEELIIWD